MLSACGVGVHTTRLSDKSRRCSQFPLLPPCQSFGRFGPAGRQRYQVGARLDAALEDNLDQPLFGADRVPQ